MESEIKVISAAGDSCYFLALIFEQEATTTVEKCREQGLALPFDKVPIGEISSYPSVLSNSKSGRPSEAIIERMKAASSLLSINSDQGSKFALRIRFIAKNCESEANSLRRKSLSVRFAINTTNSHNCEFAELRKITKANSYLIRKF